MHGGILPVGLRTNWGVNTTDDGDTSYVWSTASAYVTDLYQLDDVSLTGTINSVTIYVKAKAESSATTRAGARTVVSDGTDVIYGTEVTLGDTYQLYSTPYTSKPFPGGGAWTWADINALQAGVALQRSKAPPSAIPSRCTLVYVIVDYTPVVCEWIGETAWAAGTRYNEEQGNWATYTAYSGEELTVTLYAGQTLEAGTVHFSSPVDGVVTITITLNAGWRFKAVAENVKVQDYAIAPSGNPSPGQFAWKGDATGSPFSIDAPVNSFYGVHVDVEREVCE